MNDTVAWVDFPKGGGRGKGTPRLSAAHLARHPAGGEKLRIMTSLFEAIGSPSKVTVVVDKRRGRFALRPDEAGRAVTTPHKKNVEHRTNLEVSVCGLSEAIGVPGRLGSVRLRAAVVDGMILMEPIALPVPCAQCHGTGVRK